MAGEFLAIDSTSKQMYNFCFRVDSPEITGEKSKLDNDPTYITPRHGGTCILGGTYQEDNYDLAIDNDIAKGIYEQCTAVEPLLHVSQGAKILSLNVGLRPARRGGPRVELETIQLPLKSELVPHYGDGEWREDYTCVWSRVGAFGL